MNVTVKKVGSQGIHNGLLDGRNQAGNEDLPNPSSLSSTFFQTIDPF